MTHTISRRTVAKGAAWAAPSVIASTTIPAYAASKCADYKQEYVSTKIKEIFDDYYKRLGTRNMTFNFWWAGTSAQNGGIQEAALRVTYVGDANELRQFPLEFEVGIRNVDTSIAVNNLLAGKTIQDWTFPAKYPVAGLDDTGGRPVGVGTCQTRSGNIRSSFIRVFDDDQRTQLVAGAIQQNPDMLCGDGYKYWPAQIMPTTPYYANQLSRGGMQDLMNFEFNDGTVLGQGAIYSTPGIRVAGWYPSFDTDVVKNKDVEAAIKSGCLTQNDFYVGFLKQQAIEATTTPSRAYAGLTINYYGWVNEGTSPLSIAPGEWFWADEVGNFHSNWTGEGRDHTLPHNLKFGTRPGPVSMETFLRTRMYSSAIPGELEYRDGIF